MWKGNDCDGNHQWWWWSSTSSTTRRRRRQHRQKYFPFHWFHLSSCVRRDQFGTERAVRRRQVVRSVPWSSWSSGFENKPFADQSVVRLLFSRICFSSSSLTVFRICVSCWCCCCCCCWNVSYPFCCWIAGTVWCYCVQLEWHLTDGGGQSAYQNSVQTVFVCVSVYLNLCSWWMHS